MFGKHLFLKLKLTPLTKLRKSVLSLLLLFSRASEMKSLKSCTLHLPEKAVFSVVLSRTVSTVDMVSNIGGTFGLFCGTSILSVVEVLYWVAKMSWSTKSNGSKERGET